MSTNIPGSDLKKQFQDAWAKQQATLNGERSTAYFSQREKAFDVLKTSSFPDRKVEDWKYTSLQSMLKSEPALVYPFATGEEALQVDIPFDAYKIVSINGSYRDDLSDQVEGILISTFSQAANHKSFTDSFGRIANQSDNIFWAANAALPGSGVFIHVPENLALEKPICLISLVDADHKSSMVQERYLCVAEKGSHTRIIEWNPEKEAQWYSNKVVEISVAADANLEHYVLQDNLASGTVRQTAVRQASSSHYENFTITTSGELVRNDLNILLEGEHSDCTINGLYLLDGKQHVDNHSAVDHLVPNCESSEYYKGVLDGDSTGVFNGKVFVRQDAQKTNAYQQNRNLLLTDEATINTKPQLEIWADDVKCSHGATVGQLDMDQLFYFQARGLDKEKARALLVFAFAAEVVEMIPYEPVKDYCLALVDRKLGLSI